MNATTPLMKQFLALKREIPQGAILFFRVGNFYETFGEDAAIAAPIVRCTPTIRGGVEMCGFPAHLIDTYLARCIRAGKTVALADYAETTQSGKLTRREITRIVTPGTASEEGVSHVVRD